MADAAGVKVAADIRTTDNLHSAAGNGAMWGGFGSGDWNVYQKGAGFVFQPWMAVAALAALLILKRRKG